MTTITTDMIRDYYRIITSWIKTQWQKITLEHLVYIIVFSLVLSYITEYILRFKKFRILYYVIIVLLFVKLIEGGHSIDAAETVYKLALV